MKKDIKKYEKVRYGSALIMTIVLTVLLAIVAVMFVAVARMDSAATSNIAENKTLDLAAESIIDILNQQLIDDVPGVAAIPQDYYDYPGTLDTWLASNEPYQDATNPAIYKWGQISDVTGFLQSHSYSTTDVDTDHPGVRDLIDDYPIINLDGSGDLQENYADADGDGVLDSKWFELADGSMPPAWGMRTSKGKKIYAAVRVIDNSGMVNVNTADEFNPTGITNNYPAPEDPKDDIDGTTQMQINLKGFLRGTISQINTQFADLHTARGTSDWGIYSQNVIWQYGIPTGGYLPFDISDELELRYRYCINSKFESRLENILPQTSDAIIEPGSLYDGGNRRLIDWQGRIADPNYNNIVRRPFLTTLNLDRIIAPAISATSVSPAVAAGSKMTNLNNVTDPKVLYGIIRQALTDGGYSNPDIDGVAAQIAVNIIDYRDNNSDVTYFDPGSGTTYYGFEAQPFITKIAAYIPVDPTANQCEYALELYNPFNIDIPLTDFTLSINGTDITFPSGASIKAGKFFVIYTDLSHFSNVASDTAFENRLILSGNYILDGTEWHYDNYDVTLTRTVNSNKIRIDYQPTNNDWFLPASSNKTIYVQRDKNNWVYQEMEGDASYDMLGVLTQSTAAGSYKNYNITLANQDQLSFVTIGDIGRVLKIGPKTDGSLNASIGEQLAGFSGNESQARMDFAIADYQQIFNYLTVIDPYNAVDRLNPNPAYLNETRIKGRININTAPAFVIAQLPWVSNRDVGYTNNLSLAKAIVAYRDKQNLSPSGPDFSGRTTGPGFENIGQLTNVTDSANRDYSIDYYKTDNADQTVFPDLTPDTAKDDFEERDLIFARISDLVTVRSDVFTVYILVRVCTNVNSSNEVEGPQKRYIAIIDRSEVTPTNQKVKIRAFGVVPEAR